ncbi:unnamed protein product [Prunus brigantina]
MCVLVFVVLGTRRNKKFQSNVMKCWDSRMRATNEMLNYMRYLYQLSHLALHSYWVSGLMLARDIVQNHKHLQHFVGSHQDLPTIYDFNFSSYDISWEVGPL